MEDGWWRRGVVTADWLCGPISLSTEAVPAVMGRKDPVDHMIDEKKIY